MTLSPRATLGCGVMLLGLFGCSHDEPRDTTPDDPGALEAKPFASERPRMALLPAPRPEWIEYSAKDRKLSFYQLRASGRWMVKRSKNEAAYPVGPETVMPEGIDPAEAFVYYVRPGGQTSLQVSLAQIQSAGREHVSIAR